MKTPTKVILSVIQIIFMLITVVLLSFNPMNIKSDVLIPSLLLVAATAFIALVKIMDDLGPKEACA